MKTMSGRSGIVLALAVLLVGAGYATGALVERPRGAEGDATGDGSTEIGELREWIEAGRYADAQLLARELLPRVEQEHGRRSIETAELLDLLSEALRRGGKALSAETLQTAEQALEIKAELLGPDDPSVAVSLHNLATVHYKRREHNVARALFERSLAIREKALGPDDPLVALSLDYLGNLLADMGRSADAVPLLERGLEIRERSLGPDHPEVAWSLNGLGKLHYTRGDYAVARPLYERALAIREAALPADHPFVSISQNNLALLLIQTGDYASARKLYERALAIREEVMSPTHPTLAGSLENLGGLLILTGDFTTARPLLERALGIREATFGTDHPDIVWSLDLLGELWVRMGRFAEAKQVLERGLRIREKSLGPRHVYVAASLASLGSWQMIAGEYDAAKPILERAAAIQKERLGDRHADLAGTTAQLAAAHHALGSLSDARRLYEEALSIQESSIGDDHPQYAANLILLARLLAETGKKRVALETALRAEAISREHLLLTGRFLAERQVLRYAVTRPNGIELALGLVAGGLREGASLNDAWSAQIRSRAVVFDELAARSRVPESSDDPGLARLTADVRRASRRLANLVVRGPDDGDLQENRRLVDEARREKESAERALAERSAEFRREQSRQQIDLEEVARALQSEDALLAFSVYTDVETSQTPAGGNSAKPESDRYLAWVLTGEHRKPAAVSLGSAAELSRLIADWRSEAATGALAPGGGVDEAEAAYRTVGEALRGRIWDPVAPLLKGAKRLFVVPEGLLHLVNFSALPMGEASYLIETGPRIHHLSAERDLVLQATGGRSGRGLLAFGNPRFDESSLFAALGTIPPPSREASGDAAPSSMRCVDFRDWRFESLPATADEARRIASLWTEQLGTDAAFLEQAGASESAFKSQAPGKRVLHLATHGFFLDGRCGAAPRGLRGIGGLQRVEDRVDPAEPLESPLLLSGLALAGANHRTAAGAGEEDGILTAEEIAALDLSGVEWAVLSACETGIGEIVTGEGVFGLRRAFQLAGTGTVIMSLWSVDDLTTRHWMLDLYRGRLSQKLGTADAVHMANLAALKRSRERRGHAHPFFWAGFIAAGDWK